MRYWVVGLAIALIVSNGFWGYKFIDDAITRTYSAASYETTSSMLDQAIVLANLKLIGQSVDQAKARIGRDIRGFEPFQKEGCLYVEGICLKHDENDIITEIVAGNAQ